MIDFSQVKFDRFDLFIHERKANVLAENIRQQYYNLNNTISILLGREARERINISRIRVTYTLRTDIFS